MNEEQNNNLNESNELPVSNFIEEAESNTVFVGPDATPEKADEEPVAQDTEINQETSPEPQISSGPTIIIPEEKHIEVPDSRIIGLEGGVIPAPPPEEADNEANFEKLPENTDPNVDTITVDKVCKTYKGRTVVNHVSLNIKKGEIVGLLGPNGAGKTTTFYMVVGLVKPDEGNVYYNNENITKKAMYQRARMGVGYLPQEASVFRKLTVKENIWLILENIDISEKERKERLDKLITDLDIGRIADSKGYALSGGERRRVEIARALAAEPSFILLDEPFAGVDPIAVADIQSTVLKLQQKGLGLLITDHNVSETLAIVDRAYILSLGKILVSGSAQFVADNPTARKFYLGDRFKLDKIKK